MGKDWESLAGERGKRVDSSRLGRALKLGRLATHFTGSVIKAQFRRREPEVLATAALNNAKQIVEVMGEMKGAAMKVGQLLSADPDLIDQAFADRLAHLQRNAPPMTFLTVQAQIEAALDRPISQLFRFFDPEPLGSASIGQVHRAQLFDGREVAIKVQYPGILDSLESDLRNLSSLLKLGRVFMSQARAQSFIVEARTSLLREADYLAEAEQLSYFQHHLGGRFGLRIPAPIRELCRSSVLTMEFLPGEKLDEALQKLDDPQSRLEIIERFVEAFVFMFHDLRRLHADPHPGNFLLTPEGEIGLLDFGCVREFSPELSDGVLRVLMAFWDDDTQTILDVLKEMGFSRRDAPPPSLEDLHTYLHIILEPIAERRPFNFYGWRVHARQRAFIRKHLKILNLVPPAEMLLYFRVLAGLKGMHARVDVARDLRKIAEACCRRHGYSL